MEHYHNNKELWKGVWAFPNPVIYNRKVALDVSQYPGDICGAGTGPCYKKLHNPSSDFYAKPLSFQGSCSMKNCCKRDCIGHH